jgi:hypothetical protein
MATKDDLKKLIDELPEDELDRAFGILVSVLHVSDVPQGDEETRSWLEAAGQDMVAGIRAAEADIPQEELDDWLASMEAAVKPL